MYRSIELLDKSCQNVKIMCNERGLFELFTHGQDSFACAYLHEPSTRYAWFRFYNMSTLQVLVPIASLVNALIFCTAAYVCRLMQAKGEAVAGGHPVLALGGTEDINMEILTQAV